MRFIVLITLIMFIQGALIVQTPVHAGDEPFIGEIRFFAGNFAPRGWAFCDGQLLSVSQNSALFSILGTTYGGDGRTTFGLPDLRGRAPVHFGQGPGLTNRPIGQGFGAETVTLQASNLPVHSHILQGSTNPATQSDPTNNLLGSPQGDNIYTAAGGSQVAMNGASIGNTGGNQPHANMQPSIAIRCIISLIGTFPSRN